MRSFTLSMLMWLVAGCIGTVWANGISVSSVSLTGQNTTVGSWQVQFNVTWNNSWRDAVNWDGAWVFAKFKVGSGPWTHVRLDTNVTSVNTGTGTGATVLISRDSVGSIIYRNAAGSGTFTQTGVQLRWHYAPQGVQNSDVPEVRVYAIEMVYISSGNFTIGDGNGSSEATNALRGTSGVPNSYTVNTNLSPPISAASAFLNGNNIVRIDGDGGVDNDGDGVIDNPNYPVGWNPYYIMKYEITQEQYADFLNVLTPTQQTTRWMGFFNSNGQRINSFSGNTVFLTDRPDRGQNYMNWSDAAAYADWSGLRPFTETEYEKACRGPLAPVVNEYAWGTTSSSGGTGLTITGTENGTETASSMANNSWFFGYTVSSGDGGSSRPVRVGLCTGAGETRTDGGTSWYGVVDMSSNLGEMVVNISTTAGRSFTGLHGDGILSTNGHANVAFWPGMNGNTNNSVANGSTGEITATAAAGAGTKGNYNCSTTNSYRVSFRSCIENNTTINTRSSCNDMGFRAARTQW